MPTSAELTDAYLAALLEKDANDRANGIRPRSDRPRDGPKPNLRFLRNIIKETDSHNSVLLERERRLASGHARSAQADTRSHRHNEEPSRKRQRVERPDRWASVLGHAGIKTRTDDRSRRDARHDRSGRHGSHRRERSRDRSRSPRSDRRRGDAPARRRSRSPSVTVTPPARKQRAATPQQQGHDHDSDSDPLEAVVGPLPAPVVSARGRGTTGNSSGIDSRFADPNYDPSKDTRPEDDDDWDMALSAMQDRQKWRVIGADRLRAAGFDEADIRKWENNSGLASKVEKDIDDVRWSKRGEARDWDRGKTIDADGSIVSKPPWADT